MVVIVTANSIEHEGTRVATTFNSQLSNTQGQRTLQPEVGSSRNSNLISCGDICI